MKDEWPPKEGKNVETIAASFVPPANGSAVRMFNLASDVPVAGLTVVGSGGKHQQLADQVKYSLGSHWVPVSTAEQEFSAVVGSDNTTDDGAISVVGALATATFSPPAAPEVFTTFLMGSKSFGYSLLPQLDAPETGPCRPT